MLTETDSKTVSVQLGTGPTVQFVATPRGMALSSLGLGELLGYARPRNVHRVVKHLFGPDTQCLRDKRQWFLVRTEVEQVLQHSYNTPDVVRQLWEYFDHVEPTPKAVTMAPEAVVAATPAPAAPAAVTQVVAVEAPLTPREQLQLGQVRVQQARFVEALIHARRIARELTPKEHRRLAHKAAEVALGELILLDPPTVAVPAMAAPSAEAVTPTTSVETRPSLGSVVHGARYGNAAPSGPAEPPCPAPPRPTGDPFNFVAAAPAVPKAPPPVDAKGWMLTRFNPPVRSTASELAYLIGYGCTKQKIGIEAGRLGYKEGHPWVETKQVLGRHSNREDCTVYYYNRDASLGLIEAVLTNPTSTMRKQLAKEPTLPLDLFKAQTTDAAQTTTSPTPAAAPSVYN